MSVIRVQKNRNYTVMSNVHLRDKTLTLKAKGLLSVILSLPDDWSYSIAGLVAICKENETAVKSALKELKDAGFINVVRLTPAETESGRFEYIYDVYEVPQQVEKQEVENLPVENIPVYKDTKKEITKELNTDKYNTDYMEIVDLYHRHCPSLPKVVKITDARKKSIKARLKKYQKDTIVKTFQMAEQSDFLKNGSGTWNGATFDWIMNERNMVKILEGDYSNKKKNTLDSFYGMAADWAKNK